MKNSVSHNTQTILLLTAPLIVGPGKYSSDLLTHGEYNRLVRILCENQREPSDLLGPDAESLINKFAGVIDGGRLKRLLERGFLLSQAIERWQARTIWVISQFDPDYPKRLKIKLKEAAPAILYGCGDLKILETCGLAVVGSRNVNDVLIEYTENIGRLVAQSHHTIVSGGARGIDQAAMFGALQGGGQVVGVMSDSLERNALARDNRKYLMDQQLVLISPYDPASWFDVAHAMQRNKIIYALANVALIVSSDYEKGGTWSGAIEQLEKLHLVPLYVRSDAEAEKGLKALRQRGALLWPNPQNLDEFFRKASGQDNLVQAFPGQTELPLSIGNESTSDHADETTNKVFSSTSQLEPAMSLVNPADELFAKVKELTIQITKMPKNETEVADALQVPTSLARTWLHRLVDEGALKKTQKPLRYFSTTEIQKNLFNIEEQKKK